MQATPPAFEQISHADDGCSTSWDEERLQARKGSAKARGIWVAAAAAAAAGLVAVAVAGSWWTARGGMGLAADSDVQLATVYTAWSHFGCSNWAPTEIERFVATGGIAECEQRCSANPLCTSFNWQQKPCEPGWYVENGCLLFKESCDMVKNVCWTWHLKGSDTAPPPPAPADATTTVAQVFEVTSTASAEEVKSAIEKALEDEEGVAPVTVEVEVQDVRRLAERNLVDEPVFFKVTWTKKCVDESTCGKAFLFANNVRGPVHLKAFKDKLSAGMPTGKTVDVTAREPTKVSEGSCMADTAAFFKEERKSTSKIEYDVDVDRYVHMSMKEAKPCINRVKTPAALAKKTVLGLKEFFDSFYAYTYLAKDPTTAGFAFADRWTGAKLGIFGDEGGGAPAELSKVDLIGGLQAVADGLPQEGDVPANDWLGPLNDLFNSLRDSHVRWWGYTQPDPMWALETLFSVHLMSGGKLVMLTVNAAEKGVPIDGVGVPVVKDGSGNVVVTVGGMEPMEWLLKNIAEPSTFSRYGRKSVGSRINLLVAEFPRHGFWEHLGGTGSLEGLSKEPIIPVVLKDADGKTSSSSWEWRMVTRVQGAEENCTDFDCLINHWCSNFGEPGRSAKLLLEVGEALTKDWKHESRRAKDEILYGDSASENQAFPEAQGLEPAAPARQAADGKGKKASYEDALGADIFALVPTVDGFLAFQKDADGSEYGVLKMKGFSPAKGGKDEELPETLSAFRSQLAAFNKEAVKRGVKRLLVDVVGNGGGRNGGISAIAQEFVQWLFADMPYEDTCSVRSRPIPEAYKLWRKINYVKLEEYLDTMRPGPGLLADRVKEGAQDPKLVEAVLKNAKLIFSSLENLKVLKEEEKKKLDDALAGAKTPVQQLGAVLTVFVEMWREGSAGENPFTAKGNKAQAAAFESSEEKLRGDTTREFSARYLDCPVNDAGGEVVTFTDIVFLSNGLCGSSCWTALGGAMTIAKLQSKRSVRTLTYGGVGGSLTRAQETLSPTSFPGGDVQSNGERDVIKPVLRALLIELMLGNIIGDVALVKALGGVWNKMMASIPYYSFRLPTFTQAATFFPAFGPDAPPDEFIFLPTDMYLPEWWCNVWSDNNDLKPLYLSASRAFKK